MRQLVSVVFLLAGCSDSSDLQVNGGFPPPPYGGYRAPDATPVADQTALADGQMDAAPGDGASIDASQGCALDPGSITVSGGDLVGATVAASSPIVGTIEVLVERRDGCGTCPFFLVTAGSWEDPALVASCDGPVAATGPVTRTITVTLQAPQTPGSYQLIVAGRADHSCPEVASASTGTPVYGDGNDITAWPVGSISGGSICVNWLEAGAMREARVPAAAVSITVQ